MGALCSDFNIPEPMWPYAGNVFPDLDERSSRSAGERNGNVNPEEDFFAGGILRKLIFLSKGTTVNMLLASEILRKESLPFFYFRIVDNLVDIAFHKMVLEEGKYYPLYDFTPNPAEYPDKEFVPSLLVGYEVYFRRIQENAGMSNLDMSELCGDLEGMFKFCCNVLGYEQGKNIEASDRVGVLLLEANVRFVCQIGDIAKARESAKGMDLGSESGTQ
ncbi:hypothetical protein JW796_04015 [Candidatus Dojkabacteria bacterium]|nr:hypothetical protein [Candidatus Dojkabacteria bacterium]